MFEEADYRPHNMSIVHRSGYTQPEIHETKWDMYVILDGAGTIRMGGQRMNWVSGLPPEQQRPQLESFEEFPVTQCGLVHVPAKSWHQILTPEDGSITYALINVHSAE